MEALHTIWGFLLLGTMLVFPQLLGVLLFFLLKGRPHFLAHVLSFITPVLFSIFLTWLIFIYRYTQAHPHDGCGMPILGGVVIMLFGGCLQLIFGAFSQVILHSRAAICARRLS
ncbi:MAG TPA: hypothetical protein VFD75_08200 [Pyrinomonadaceae bacterium]|nr:hypothetical protein [Pyrinomonadaceae bacterium]